MRPLFFLVFLFSATHFFAQNVYPEITNLSVQIDENTQMVTINYDLFDAEDEAMQITFLVSNNNGESYTIPTENATGEVGSSIQSGDNKSITWDASGRLTGIGNYKIKLVADDLFEIDIQTIVDQVDSNRILSNLEFIQGVRHRNNSLNHIEAVKDTIEQRFITSDLETYRQDFPFGNYTGQNIIGRLEGTTAPDQTYIIDGHFDTVSSSPGADDNGSGVAGLLEASRILAPYRFNKTLRFIGFDLEEEGLRGAFAYTDTGIGADETIEGVFNMEMIGYFTNEPNTQTFPNGFDILYPDVQADLIADEFRGNFITNIGDEASVPLQMAYDAAAAQYVPGLKTVSLKAPAAWQVFTPDFGRSDHAPFWLKGIPALMLTDGSNFRNPNYHSANDLIQTLNFTFMTNVVKAVVGALAEEAGIQHSTTAVADFSVLTSLNKTLDCGLKVSPIPADENIQLHFENCDFEQLTVQVFDVLGKVVLEGVMHPNLSVAANLDLAALDAGVYCLSLSDGDRRLSRKLVVY